MECFQSTGRRQVFVFVSVFFLEMLEKLIKVSFSVMATLTLLGKLDAINVGRKGDRLCFVLCEL